MPELPEVEFAAQRLREWLIGRRIARAEAEPSRIFRPARPEDVARALAGQTLEAVDRRAKFLLLTFDSGLGALSHLGMTGKWVRREEGEPARFSKLRLLLGDGSVVHYCDPRMFGQLVLHPATALATLPAIASLGPDPLRDGLTAKQLGERLARTRRPIKLALMDQSVLAGLGNIHAAEALYRAKLHPERPASSLDASELARLTRAIQTSIAFALKQQEREAAGKGEFAYVEEGGENPFLVYGRKGEVCGVCGGRIEAYAQGGRTTSFCPGCQKR